MAKRNKNKTKNQATRPPKKHDRITEWEERFRLEDQIRKDFRKQCNYIEDIYTGKKAPFQGMDDDPDFNFNILWVNTEILLSALYSRNPSPDVRRRYKDSIDRLAISREQNPQKREQIYKEELKRIETYNDLGKKVAMLMERGLTYVQDTQDYFGNSQDAVKSFIKFAAGQVRVRYVPYISKGSAKMFPVKKNEVGEFEREDGEEIIDLMEVQGTDEEGYFLESKEEFEEELEHEELITEWVPIQNFRWEPNASWDAVGWGAIEHYLNYEQLEEEFGEELAKKIPLTHTNEGSYVDISQRRKETAKPTKALIYECFDKRTRKVEVFAKDYNELLRNDDDPYNLEGFYPFPKPMLGTMGDDGTNPVPDYEYYKDFHAELNTIMFRINKLLNVVKYRGFYDASLDKLLDIEGAADGDFKALTNFAQLAAMTDGKSLDLRNFMAVVPIEQAAALLNQLYGYRDRTVQSIHEITGISDIARGSSKENETLGAQQLKAQYTSLRLQNKTKEVERFFRDVKRIEAEFLAEQFEDETLEGMTGMTITPEMSEILNSDLLRGFIVDVETDSTVVMDSAVEQRERTEALNAMSGMFNQIMPLVNAGLIPKELGGQFILFGLKGFKGARELEDQIQELMDTTAPIGLQGQPAQPGQPGAPGAPQQQQTPQKTQTQQILEELDTKIKTEQLRKYKGEADAIELENDAASSGIMSIIEELAKGAPGAPGAAPNA